MYDWISNMTNSQHSERRHNKHDKIIAKLVCVWQQYDNYTGQVVNYKHSHKNIGWSISVYSVASSVGWVIVVRPFWVYGEVWCPSPHSSKQGPSVVDLRRRVADWLVMPHSCWPWLGFVFRRLTHHAPRAWDVFFRRKQQLLSRRWAWVWLGEWVSSHSSRGTTAKWTKQAHSYIAFCRKAHM